MRFLFIFLTTIGLVMYPSLVVSATAIERDAARVLLVSYDTEEVKLGAKLLVQSEGFDEELFDLAAQRLVVYFDSYPQLDVHSDTVSWLARALEASANSRYGPILENVHARISSLFSERHAAKVDRYMQPAMQATSGAVENAFVPQDLPFEAIRDGVLASREVASPDATMLVNVQEGMPATDIYTQFGVPDYIVERVHRVRRGMYGRVNLQNLELRYSGVAAIRLHHVDGRWQVYESESLEDTERLATALSSDDPLIYRVAAQTLISERQFQRELLDLAASNAWANAETEDPLEIDAVAWLCKALGASKNPRYRQVLERVFAITSQRKLQSHVEQALNGLDSMVVSQFEAE